MSNKKSFCVGFFVACFVLLSVSAWWDNLTDYRPYKIEQYYSNPKGLENELRRKFPEGKQVRYFISGLYRERMDYVSFMNKDTMGSLHKFKRLDSCCKVYMRSDWFDWSSFKDRHAIVFAEYDEGGAITYVGVSMYETSFGKI